MDQPVSNSSMATGQRSDLTPRVLWTLAIIGIFFGFNLVDRGLLSLNVDPIKHELHASDTEMSLATGIAYFLFNGIAAVPIARFADRHSRRYVLGIGFGFYSLVMGLTGFVSNFAQLLVARVVLGVGEASVAGSSPLINDLVKPQNRRKALAGMRVFSSIVVMGMMAGLGHVSEIYGWRASFLVLAVPAAVLVPLMLYTVYEPPHELSRGGAAPPKVTLRQTLASWRRSPAFLFVLLGFALSGVTLQANGAWAGAFMARVRGMSPSEIGTLSGIARGPALLAGSIFAGWITDRLARRDHRWRFWVPGIMLMIGTPCEFLYLNLPSHLWMWAYVLTGSLIMGSQACAMALMMDVSGPGARATGLAFGLLVMSLLADFMGPTSIGVMNDTIFKSLGPEALRYSMAIVACSAAVGGALMVYAARFETEATRSG